VTNSWQNRIIRWAERALLLLLVLYLCIHTMSRAWNSLVTDFPNYYMAARLVHEGYDTSRMYEWEWLQREKDHRAVDIRVIGLIPITPFSTLAMWPISGFEPLTAKRTWTIFNLVLLIPIGWMLRSMTSLSYQRIALIFALSLPLHRNLLYGQLYILLMLLIVAACWTFMRGLFALAGIFIAIAAACKIFPILFMIFFLQRRAWRSIAWGFIAGVLAFSASIVVFGWNTNRTYLFQILPSALHGGGLQPYAGNASISGVLHCLFLSEPQWNPHPWHYSPLCYAVLLPILQMLAIAPAILLIRSRCGDRDQVLLEWCALLTASLTISTFPASYNFVLMVMPVSVLAAHFLRRNQHFWLAVLMIVFLGIGCPMPSPHTMVGPAILFYEFRLPLMLLLLLGIYVLLLRDTRDNRVKERRFDWTGYAWAGVMAVAVVVTARSTLYRESAAREEYAYRLPLNLQGLLNASPLTASVGIRYVAFSINGYHLVTESGGAGNIATSADSLDDVLSFADAPGSIGIGDLMLERLRDSRSEIISPGNPSHVIAEDAQDPMLSVDGRSLAFVRTDHGRGRFMIRRDFKLSGTPESILSPDGLDVYEASFLSESDYAFSAVENGQPPRIYSSDPKGGIAMLALGEARYPALSPNGHYLTYSHLENGVWNLWLRDQSTGAVRRIADLPCNQIEPSWDADGKTLLYSTDCGRSLWFTAIARRRIIP